MRQLTDDLSYIGAQFDQMVERSGEMSEYAEQHQLSRYSELLQQKNAFSMLGVPTKQRTCSYGINYKKFFSLKTSEKSLIGHLTVPI